MTNEVAISVEVEEKLFELAQRKAKVYSESTLVPKEYAKQLGNVMIAMNMAQRMGADVLQVMQNLYIVHGKPGWSAQFLIACFNSCGRFTAIKYRFSGKQGNDDWGCVAYATERSSGEVIEGPLVTIQIAKNEGWYGKAGSKWKTIPQLMLCYRAATFLVRVTAPEIGLGLSTAEELHDIPVNRNGRETESADEFAKLMQYDAPIEVQAVAPETKAPGELFDHYFNRIAKESRVGMLEILREEIEVGDNGLSTEERSELRDVLVEKLAGTKTK